MRCSVFFTSILYFLNIDTALAQAGVLYQYSKNSALLAGYYDGDINIYCGIILLSHTYSLLHCVM